MSLLRYRCAMGPCANVFYPTLAVLTIPKFKQIDVMNNSIVQLQDVYP